MDKNYLKLPFFSFNSFKFWKERSDSNGYIGPVIISEGARVDGQENKIVFYDKYIVPIIRFDSVTYEDPDGYFSKIDSKFYKKFQKKIFNVCYSVAIDYYFEFNSEGKLMNLHDYKIDDKKKLYAPNYLFRPIFTRDWSLFIETFSKANE